MDLILKIKFKQMETLMMVEEPLLLKLTTKGTEVRYLSSLQEDQSRRTEFTRVMAATSPEPQWSRTEAREKLRELRLETLSDLQERLLQSLLERLK